MADKSDTGKKDKDLWDKLSALSIPIATVVVGITGATLTLEQPARAGAGAAAE